MDLKTPLCPFCQTGEGIDDYNGDGFNLELRDYFEADLYQKDPDQSLDEFKKWGSMNYLTGFEFRYCPLCGQKLPNRIKS